MSRLVLKTKTATSEIQKDVRNFHEKCGVTITGSPLDMVSAKDRDLRIRLVLEEAREVVSALLNDDRAELARELVDQIYIAVGTAVTYGIDLGPVWEIIQRANMMKNQSKDGSGKVIKPQGWVDPQPEVVAEIFGQEQHAQISRRSSGSGPA